MISRKTGGIWTRRGQFTHNGNGNVLSMLWLDEFYCTHQIYFGEFLSFLKAFYCHVTHVIVPFSKILCLNISTESTDLIGSDETFEHCPIVIMNSKHGKSSDKIT